MNTKAARRSPQVVSACNFLMSSRVRAGLHYPFCSVIVHATMLEPPLVSGEREVHGLHLQFKFLRLVFSYKLVRAECVRQLANVHQATVVS